MQELASMTPKRLVLDTNIWLDWLVFRDSCVLFLQNEVSEGRARIFIDAACEAELERVLAYPLGRHSIGAAAQAACLAEARRIARRVDTAAPKAERRQLPRCRDPDDQKLLELALASCAQYLVTRDHALLELARRVQPFRIVTPAKFPADQAGR
jgi:putative PIN family toxin of toxin-antitoxin system